MTNQNGNRAERRHPSPEPPAKLPEVHVHLQTSDRGPQLAISSFAANILLQLANGVPVPGSNFKMQLAIAQMELEEGLKNPLPKVEDQASAAPLESAPEPES